MINAIGFDNYRIFDKETILNLKPITILTGPNSSGKSSVIKAVKLLKQNTLKGYIEPFSAFDDFRLHHQNRQMSTVGKLPRMLNFIPDNYGHFLSSLSRILNNSGRKRKDKNISFLIPVDLPAIWDSCFVKLTYGASPESNTSGELIEYSILYSLNGENRILVKLIGESGTFNQISVDFESIKYSFEEVFIPILKNVERNLKNDTTDNDIITDDKDYFNNVIYYLPKYGNNSEVKFSGNWAKDYENIVHYQKWMKYDSTLPILPYYKLLIDDIDQLTADLDDSEGIIKFIHYLRKKFAIDYNPDGNEENLLNDEKYRKWLFPLFKDLEKQFFKFIKDYDVLFDTEGEVEYNNFTSIIWNGIHSSDIDSGEQFYEENKGKKLLLDFDPFEHFISIYEIIEGFKSIKYLRSREEEIVPANNHVIIYEFIRQNISDSFMQIIQKIEKSDFFDSNRVEQTLFYHPTNSKVGYNLLVGNEKLSIQNNKSHSTGFNPSNTNIKYIQTQIQRIGIADNFKIVANELGIYSVFLIKNDIERPLSEFGYGITKIFFLLLTIIKSQYKTLFIEEPETNLHPDLQAKLAEILVEAHKLYGIQLIIETHSEYFIRKLQYLAARKEIDNDEILINYFNHEALRKTNGVVVEININKDGSLDGEFGTGFYDEAANLISGLFKLSSYN